MSSVLRAITAGELLAALPECESARSDHLAALDLLAMLEMEIAELQAALC